jgi:hypothetical protein
VRVNVWVWMWVQVCNALHAVDKGLVRFGHLLDLPLEGADLLGTGRGLNLLGLHRGLQLHALRLELRNLALEQ